MDYNAGTFTATIEDYGFKPTNSGNIMIAIAMKYDQAEGQTKKLTWFGSLNEGKAREITLKTLKDLGYAGQDFSLLNAGKQSGILKLDQKYSIVVEIEEYNGKKRPKIKWINLPGQSTFETRMDNATVKHQLAGMNLKADIIGLFGMNNTTPKKEETPPAFATEVIPF